MKKLLKRIMALSLCACMMMGAASTASAAQSESLLNSGMFKQYNTNHYINVYATTPSNIVNGTRVTTWNVMDPSGCQSFSVYNETDGTLSYHTMKIARATSYVLSKNRQTGYIEMYTKGGDNPYTDYGLTVNPLYGNNSSIRFYSGNYYLGTSNVQYTWGNEYGYRLNYKSGVAGGNDFWTMT